MDAKARQAGEGNVSNTGGILFAGWSAYLVFRVKKNAVCKVHSSNTAHVLFSHSTSTLNN